jgi:type II secretory pathway component PulJ
MNRTSGFTLVDWLTALALLAMIACIGWALLHAARPQADAPEQAATVGIK